LTLLRLYRKHPSVLPITDWAERIVSMIDDSDPGVALTVTTLITAMAQDALEAFSGCYQKAVKRLDRVSRRDYIRLCQLTRQIIFDGDYPPEYVYYKVCRPRVTKLRTVLIAKGSQSVASDQALAPLAVLSTSG
jgi:AP-2 complex subunit alpha